MKKLSLRLLMFVQAVIAFCIPLYYHLMMTYGLNSNVPLFIAIVILLIVGKLKHNSEIMDEYAKQTLQIADSICFKISIVIMGIIVLPFLFMGTISSLLIGYLLTLGIFVLVLIRACIFYWIDKNGMD
ncbi:MAG: hypothetical protein PHS82_14345 [Lachnospiraceae bacterium]|nr:hypothetical protein [Lachnospiraceae bacterium]